MSYARFEFPRIDLTIDVEGTKLDYSFHLDGYANSSANSCNVMVSVNSAVCREGDITLEGKRHHVVLLDYNSNGRFDDESKISENIHLANGQLYPEPGDMLLIDPKVGRTAFDSPYDPTGSDYRYYVAEMISIDGRWYDLKISPAGDKLTLTPSTVPLGNVTNRNESFRALIYGDGKGFLKIRGTKDKPIPVPEGQWKLLSYTITSRRAGQAGRESGGRRRPAGEDGRKAKPAEQARLAAGRSWATVRRRQQRDRAGAGPSVVSATATEKYKAVTVRKGETVELPFGPPYTPTVTAMSYGTPNGKAEQLYLEMSLVGVAGEACTNMMVKGARPGKPEFTITDPDGQSGATGQFRVWLRFHLPVLVASTIGACERVSRQRQDEGRSLRDRRAQRQRDPSSGIATLSVWSSVGRNKPRGTRGTHLWVAGRFRHASFRRCKHRCRNCAGLSGLRSWTSFGSWAA